jgi:hypothetical protein
MLDEMRMRTACFAHAPQRCTSRLGKHFPLTFQEVTPLRKTRNQLVAKKWTQPIREWKAALNQFVILFGERVPV